MKALKLSLIPLILIINFSSLNAQLKLISLAPSLSRQLLLLDKEKYLVGVTSYCPEPLRRSKQIIGSPLVLNIERILLLKPDYILAASINYQKQIRKLKALGLKVIYFELEKSYDDVKENFLKLARLLNEEEKAQMILEQIDKKLHQLERIKEKKKVLLQVGIKPLVVVGGESFLNDILKFSSGINVAEELGKGFFRLSREKVLELNPEVIILILHGSEVKRAKHCWKKYKYLKAVKNNAVYSVKPDEFCQASPDLFLKAVQTLRSLLFNEN